MSSRGEYLDSEHHIKTVTNGTYCGFCFVTNKQTNTITVSDLLEAGVTTQILYGESAESCTLTSAPNYTETGSYPVYCQITYTYGNVNMVEDGVAYVRLVDATGHTPGDWIVDKEPTPASQREIFFLKEGV